jgi:hypothetical protein
VNKRHIILLSALLALLFVSAIWQFGEADIYRGIEKIRSKLLGSSFNQITVYDEDGIPMQLYPNKERHYNPLFVAREAQRANLQRLSGEDRQDFVKLTDWLLFNMAQTDSTAVVQYYFPYPKYNQEVPWSSALAQAVSISVLLERAAMDRDLEIYATARRGLHSLLPGKAGLGYAISDSSYWYMEYPADQPYYVLNGMLSVLQHLHYYHDLTRDPLALEMYEKGLRAVKAKLPDYDYHGYSYYDLAGSKAGRHYHQLHIRLLNQMLEIEDDPILRHYRDRWQKHDSYPVLWQMIFNPRPKRITAFTLAFISLWLLISLTLAWSARRAPSDPEDS